MYHLWMSTSVTEIIDSLGSGTLNTLDEVAYELTQNVLRLGPSLPYAFMLQIDTKSLLGPLRISTWDENENLNPDIEYVTMVHGIVMIAINNFVDHLEINSNVAHKPTIDWVAENKKGQLTFNLDSASQIPELVDQASLSELDDLAIDITPSEVAGHAMFLEQSRYDDDYQPIYIFDVTNPPVKVCAENSDGFESIVVSSNGFIIQSTNIVRIEGVTGNKTSTIVLYENLDRVDGKKVFSFIPKSTPDELLSV